MFGLNGNFDAKPRSLTFFGIHADGPAVLSDDLVGKKESQPGSLTAL